MERTRIRSGPVVSASGSGNLGGSPKVPPVPVTARGCGRRTRRQRMLPNGAHRRRLHA
jgi:hypothetical protein